MLSFFKFYKFWGSFFLDLKKFKSRNLNFLNNANIKIKVSSINNDLLGMPELFFSFLFKRFQNNKYVYKKSVFLSNNILFLDLQFFLIFFLNLNSFKFFSKNCFVFIADSDLFYSNFNIFSINFLFKLKYFFKIKHQSFFLNNNDCIFFNCLSLWGLPCYIVSI
ncbi:uncharacterized protein PMYN1_Mit49 (mitochondrion) [Paulinella micropora]|uniref:Uncharacterized protein n=1 Tax=Paulinella micropora TaxID=1928728 RepID=A0A5K7VXU5_9EUKA|nr:uncharacterized protein PMYN1_Mit49 [Paulinella micropora]BBL86711.1 uncharacterized protein PMYN1_Mit49 [Paulinella micropora]